MSELNSMPQSFNSIAETLTAFMRIFGIVKESLKKIFIRGEYDEYPDDKEMHCSARLAEMLNQYSDELQGKGEGENKPAFNFLVEEIQILEEASGIGLPNFLPRTAFLTILQSKRKLSSVSTRAKEASACYVKSQTELISLFMNSSGGRRGRTATDR
ncbi:hypothetical protein Ancab_027517 [Ancistrocladus abbreviatus]